MARLPHPGGPHRLARGQGDEGQARPDAAGDVRQHGPPGHGAEAPEPVSVTIVAPYPRTKAAHGEESLGGVASYTKNLVYGMPESVDIDVIALHDQPQGPRVEGLVHV